jgi:hypothetical protein
MGVMIIDKQTIAELLQIGGQYLLPIAALLRALYSGLRGKFPEGFSQIAVASLFAGLTAAVGSENLEIRPIMLKILGNTIFMAGLLSFIMAYLLRQPNRGKTIDGIIGGILGLIFWLAFNVLNENWPWYTLPLAVMAGAAGFIVLRILLRQIAKLVKVATYCIVAGAVLVVGAGAILLVQTVLQAIPK